MNIGFIHHNDDNQLDNCWSIQSWQIFSRLQKHHTLVTTNHCPFPGGVCAYSSKWDSVSFVRSIDALFVIVDGMFNFYSEKFSLYSMLSYPKRPVVWLFNAPIRESTLFSTFNKNAFRTDSLYRKFFSRFVDVGMCVSDEVRLLLKEEVHINNIIVSPNGADPDIFNPKYAKKNMFKKHNKYTVIWAGDGGIFWQGLDVIVNVAKKMQSIDPEILFVIIGNNSWIDIPKAPNILRLKKVSYAGLPDYLHSADAAIIPYHPQFDSHFYNSPMKLFDAMSMELPIIASNLGQIHQVIRDGKNGLLTNNSIDDVIKKILYLKTHSRFGLKLGKEARNDVLAYYNWDRTVHDIDCELAKLVRSPK
jgi:glycosyltransferase involved in cell wall biosynthesis